MKAVHRSRQHVVVLRLNDDEKSLLGAIAESFALTKSDTLRQLIRAEAKRRGITIGTRPRGAKR